MMPRMTAVTMDAMMKFLTALRKSAEGSIWLLFLWFGLSAMTCLHTHQTITTDSASTLFYFNHTKGTDGFRTLRKELGQETM